MLVQPHTPPATPPPTLHVGDGTPDFLPGSMTSVDHAPHPHQNIVETNATVKVLCHHAMMASEMSHLLEAEIRQLHAENEAFRRELSACSDQARPESSPLRVAPFDPPDGIRHCSPEPVPLKSGRSSPDGIPQLSHAEGGPSVRWSSQSKVLREETDIPKDIPKDILKDSFQQPRSSRKHSEVVTDAESCHVSQVKSQRPAWTLTTTSDQASPAIICKKTRTPSQAQLHKDQQTFILESKKTMAMDLMGRRKTQIKRHLLFDPERIKTKLREEIIKPVYDVTKFYHKEGHAQAIARSSLFDNTTLGVIMLNAIWIAVDTQHNRAEVLLDADPVFQVAEQMFCTYFFVEWLVRFLAFKRKRDCKSDVWFVFDTVLMVFMVIDTWIMTVILLILQGREGGSSSLGFVKNASLIRMLRLLRITRLARAVKLLRFAPEVMVMLKAVLSSMRCVLWTFVLLICVVFLFGVGFTQLCRGSALEETYFGSLTMSMHTLLMAGVFPDLHDMSLDISTEHILYWFIWMFFMLFSSLAVLNLLVGVLVEIVKHSSNVERDSMDVVYTRQTFLKCLGLEQFQENAAYIDELTLSKEQFADLMENDLLVMVLLKIGIDILGLVDLVDWIFIGGDMKFTELMEMVLQLRSSATVTVRDIVDLRKFLTFEIHKMQADLRFMTQQIPDGSQNVIPEKAALLNEVPASAPSASGDKREHLE